MDDVRQAPSAPLADSPHEGPHGLPVHPVPLPLTSLASRPPLQPPRQPLPVRILMLPVLPFVALWFVTKAAGRWIDRAGTALGRGLLVVLGPVRTAMVRLGSAIWRGLARALRLRRCLQALQSLAISICRMLLRVSVHLRRCGTFIRRHLARPVRAFILIVSAPLRSLAAAARTVRDLLTRPAERVRRLAVAATREAERLLLVLTRPVRRLLTSAFHQAGRAIRRMGSAGVAALRDTFSAH